jgi:hypothetical protein
MNKFLFFSNDPKGVFNLEVFPDSWTVTPANDMNVDIVIYLDARVFEPNKIGKIKIAWLFEPKDLVPDVFSYIVNNYKEFDYIITWDKELLAIDPRFVFMTYGFSFIAENYCQVYPKDKLLSIVASDKRQLVGHQLRHAVIAKYRDKMDLYGRGYNPIDNLLPAFKDYMFTIAIENVARDWGFSEKIVTPIMCGTIPIYFGPDVSQFFDTRGIITFKSVEELELILPTLSADKYNEMLPYVHANFEKAKNYKRTENNIYPLFSRLGLIK